MLKTKGKDFDGLPSPDGDQPLRWTQLALESRKVNGSVFVVLTPGYVRA